MDRLAFYFALLLLLWAPLPFGSQRPWGAFLLGAAALLLFVMASLSSRRADWLRLLSAKHLVYLYAVFPVLCLVHLMPLPWSVYESAGEWMGGFAISFSPYDTVIYFFKTLSCLAIFASTLLLCDSRLRVFVFLVVVATSGVFQAAYGMFMSLSGLEYGFFVKKYAGVGRATGTIVNANHFAAYCLIGLSCIAGLLWARVNDKQISVHGRQGLDWLLVLKAAIGFLLAGVFLSNSRSASILLALMIFFGIGLHVYVSGKLSKNTAIALSAFILLDVVLVGAGFGLGSVFERFSNSEIGADGRFKVYSDSLPLLFRYAWLGIGAGAFDTVFVAHNSVQPPLRFMYLHNDYLQLLLEFGVVGFVSALLLVIMVIKRAIVALTVRGSWQIRAVAFSSLLIVIWVVLHSAVDFSMHISAIAFTTACLAGVLCSAIQLPRRQKKLSS